MSNPLLGILGSLSPTVDPPLDVLYVYLSGGVGGGLVVLMMILMLLNDPADDSEDVGAPATLVSRYQSDEKKWLLTGNLTPKRLW